MIMDNRRHSSSRVACRICCGEEGINRGIGRAATMCVKMEQRVLLNSESSEKDHNESTGSQ